MQIADIYNIIIVFFLSLNLKKRMIPLIALYVLNKQNKIYQIKEELIFTYNHLGEKSNKQYLI